MNKLLSFRHKRMGIILIALAFLPGAVSASNPNCEMPSTKFSIVKADGKLQFKVVVENESTSPITLDQTVLLEGLMQLSARKKDGGYLRHFSALEAPGAAPVVLLPGRAETRIFNLYDSFPDLEAALMGGDVVLTWQLDVAPVASDCAVQSMGTATLRGIASKAEGAKR